VTLLAMGHVASLHVARLAAFVVFALLLCGLGVALLRSRKQLRSDEAEATLEADFLKLERELREPLDKDPV
jgi:hypothetical protein